MKSKGKLEDLPIEDKSLKILEIALITTKKDGYDYHIQYVGGVLGRVGDRIRFSTQLSLRNNGERYSFSGADSIKISDIERYELPFEDSFRDIA